jgi:hypothetical protein
MSKLKIAFTVICLWWVSTAYFPEASAQYAPPLAGTGGGVGGASNLDTAGYVPYVSSSGILTINKVAGSQLFWDSANSRLAIGITNPTAQFEVGGQANSAIRVRQAGANGYIQMSTGTTSATGYIAWHLPNNNRLGYIGDSTTNVQLNLENSALFVVSGGAAKFAGGTQSSDGSAGVTVTACTAFKNGLCTAGT